MKSKQPKPFDYVDRDRHPDNWRMVFTARDSRILEHIWEYDGYLADYQVKELEFTGMRQAQDRLGKLFHNGYLARTNRMGRARFGTMVYWLTAKGAETVAGAKGVGLEGFKYLKTPRWAQVEHDLLTNSFTIILVKACVTNPEFFLFEWVNESVFRADRDTVTYTNRNGKTLSRQIIPDRYFVIDRKGERDFRARLLMELDNSTHANKNFADEKVLPGIAYLRSDVYQSRFGKKAGRWLVVTSSDIRLSYLKETTERAAGDDAKFFHFTTFNRVSVESVLEEPIWFKGGQKLPVSLFEL